jgi:hypothetical protein
VKADPLWSKYMDDGMKAANAKTTSAAQIVQKVSFVAVREWECVGLWGCCVDVLVHGRRHEGRQREDHFRRADRAEGVRVLGGAVWEWECVVWMCCG